MKVERFEKKVEQAESFGALFAPDSIAIVGASVDPRRFTGRIVPTLLRHGYPGAIYPVNPKRAEIGGLTAYPTLADVPGGVACVLYCVDAGRIMEVLAQCKAKGVRLVVVVSGGFAEAGTAEGKRLQDDALKYAHAHGIRLLGPNCIGFCNFQAGAAVSAAAVMEWPEPPRGRIGLVTQSGGLGLAAVAYFAFEEEIGFSHLISTGNEADIDTVEVGEFFVDDPGTDVIAMTIEAVKDPGRFIEFLRSAGAAHKPVVVLKSGRSSLGKTMAASHTGALAGQSEVFEMVCDRYGVTVADDIDDLYQIASMFSKLRASGKLRRYERPGAHCAALSLSGGNVGLFADHGSLAGLGFPPFRQETQPAIVDALGFDGHFQNPLDTTSRVIGDDAFWGRCVRVMMDDPDIQVVVPIITVAHSYGAAIDDFMKICVEREEIVAVVWAGGSFEPGERKRLNGSLVPVFRTTSRAARGLRALDRYCAVWNARAGRASDSLGAPASPAAARDLLLAAVREGRRVLTESDAKRVLAAAGLPETREIGVSGLAQAKAAAARLGFPVVLKGEHEEILHKSDAGIVFLDVPDEAALESAFEAIQSRIRALTGETGPVRVLVQERVRFEQELILGANTDPEFGPVVVVGIGGIFVEIANDIVMRLPPFGVEEAREMIERLRGAALLHGARGRPPADVGALAALVSGFSAFVHANRDVIAEIDVNPLVCAEGGASWRILDALIVLREPNPPEAG
ncbi:acetate--CoA ligase family protein [Castellaniella sp. WN]